MPGVIRRPARDVAKRGIRWGFELGQRAGVDVLPRHFYSQIPNVSDLRRRTDWRGPRTMVGVDGADIDTQAQFVRDTCPADIVAASNETWDRANSVNGAVGFGPIEAQFLVCFAAAHKPGRVVQVGAGVSTAVLLEAKARYGTGTEIVCVDPVPTDYLRAEAARGTVELLAQPAQTVPLEVLTDLQAGDMLFVDATHGVRPDSEANRIILEVLPRLAPDVWVHYHDVIWPFDYNTTLLTEDFFFWNETVLLHAFVTGNSHITIKASLSMLHHSRPDAISDVFPSFDPMHLVDGLAAGGGPHRPSSTYLQTRA